MLKLNCHIYFRFVTFEVPTAVSLRIQVFWHLKWCCWISVAWCFKGTLPSSWTHQTLRLQVLHYFEMPGSTQWHCVSTQTAWTFYFRIINRYCRNLLCLFSQVPSLCEAILYYVLHLFLMFESMYWRACSFLSILCRLCFKRCMLFDFMQPLLVASFLCAHIFLILCQAT